MTHIDQSDHDILVALKTSLDIVIQQQQSFIERYESRHTALVNRVSVLENKDSRDSEKFRTISEEIRRSFNNAARIDALTKDVEDLERIKDSISARSWQVWLLIIGLIISQVWQWLIP